HLGRSYHVHEHTQGETYLNPESWLAMAKVREGSWWQEWHEWLVRQNSKKLIPPPVMDQSLPAAPGTYVLQK
ncbi:TPA: PHA synthase, partial [Legionella pneumophila]|nr:PHA synthase [Legionella pneumophila]HAT1887133.1 PHA synthase [Legionella pneumophila]HBZ2995843.1 PHA synthase [Legionella pneumophila]